MKPKYKVGDVFEYLSDYMDYVTYEVLEVNDETRTYEVKQSNIGSSYETYWTLVDNLTMLYKPKKHNPNISKYKVGDWLCFEYDDTDLEPYIMVVKDVDIKNNKYTLGDESPDYTFTKPIDRIDTDNRIHITKKPGFSGYIGKYKIGDIVKFYEHYITIKDITIEGKMQFYHIEYDNGYEGDTYSALFDECIKQSIKD